MADGDAPPPLFPPYPIVPPYPVVFEDVMGEIHVCDPEALPPCIYQGQIHHFYPNWVVQQIDLERNHVIFTSTEQRQELLDTIAQQQAQIGLLQAKLAAANQHLLAERERRDHFEGRFRRTQATCEPTVQLSSEPAAPAASQTSDHSVNQGEDVAGPSGEDVAGPSGTAAGVEIESDPSEASS